MILVSFFPTLKERSCHRFAIEKSGLITSPQPRYSIKGQIIAKGKQIAKRLRNNSPDKDPALTVPLRVILLALALSAPYVAARGYLLVEDLIAFRALLPNAYKTVNWSQFFFHVRRSTHFSLFPKVRKRRNRLTSLGDVGTASKP
jgi:hypothetical protein